MTLKEFLEIEGYHEPIMLKKHNGKKHYLLWWESWDDWFLNVAFTKKTIADPKESVWVTRRDAPHWIDSLVREGYKLIGQENGPTKEKQRVVRKTSKKSKRKQDASK